MRKSLLVMSALVASILASPMGSNPSHHSQASTVRPQEPSNDPSINVPAHHTSASTAETSSSAANSNKKRFRGNSRDPKSLQTARIIRKQKVEELGLHVTSPLPMFSYKLTPKEIKEHPQIDSWHMHRQAMENEILEQHQLPPHFQSVRGEYRFKTKKAESIFTREEEEIDPAKKMQKQKSDAERTRYHKAKILKLHRKSALPRFALDISVEDLNKDPMIHNWHRYREVVEKGAIEQEDLPIHFRSSKGGSIVYRTTTERKGGHEPGTRAVQTDRVQQQKKERFEKLQLLQLHRDSSQPIFAQRITAESLTHSDEMDEWHRHRKLMEKKQMTEKNLPEHFKPMRGSFKFNPEPPFFPSQYRGKRKESQSSHHAE
jgi:hypothetical protein